MKKRCVLAYSGGLDTSVILGWPVWAVVAGLVPSFLLLAVAGLYNTVHRLSADAAEQKA